ncbi:hypothetical protein [Rhizobium mesosinicum]|uniref:Uncharacterized protein n=1 Tax=Rhizobium mesosinicum TaxID=335017 RepID=A0ABS7GRP4_9HYPH|nr:hypothetical protein [Rhizobium mesosinicum]MBW9052628.1 hypothetical protein [Rhizobium mesosinicum]
MKGIERPSALEGSANLHSAKAIAAGTPGNLGVPLIIVPLAASNNWHDGRSSLPAFDANAVPPKGVGNARAAIALLARSAI